MRNPHVYTLKTVDLAFNPDQPRDWHGRWALVGAAWQKFLDSNKGSDLRGLPGPVKAMGSEIHFHSNKSLQDVADKYNREHGLGAHPTDYVKVNPKNAERIAKAYDEMKHDPQNPKVARAYAALKEEVLAQYRAIQAAGFDYSFYPPGKDPYPSPRLAVQDLTRNKHMYVYPTVEGFGSDADFDSTDNPLLERVPGLKWGGKDVTYNDVFRAVHDTFGHAKEGLGFRADGEDNAYRQHFSMFSPEAQKALASETRGQNSWLNFGPYGAQNRIATTADTVFADQKVGLLPNWAIDPDINKRKPAMNLSNKDGDGDGFVDDGKPTMRPVGAPKQTHANKAYVTLNGKRTSLDNAVAFVGDAYEWRDRDRENDTTAPGFFDSVNQQDKAQIIAKAWNAQVNGTSPLDAQYAASIWQEYQSAHVYGAINAILRTGKADPEFPNVTAEQVRTAAQDMFRLGGWTLEKPVVLYRALKNDNAHNWAKELTPGTVFSDKGIISTTAHNNFARGWLRGNSVGKSVRMVKKDDVVLEIRTPAGQRVVGGDPQFIETMLPPDTRLRVLSSTQEVGAGVNPLDHTSKVVVYTHVVAEVVQ